MALKTKQLVFLDSDVVRLNAILQNNSENPQYTAQLAEEIKKARIVDKAHLPPGVVVMHSVISILDKETDEVSTYTLVYPWESDVDNDKISVLAPIGTALIGYGEGDEISWNVPKGVRRFKVLSVQHP